jgi:hypothetical protein
VEITAIVISPADFDIAIYFYCASWVTILRCQAACGQADFPIFPGNFLSASVGNRAAVEHSPVVCPFRVWVTKCVVRMLVGRQISHISLHFVLPWAWQISSKTSENACTGLLSGWCAPKAGTTIKVGHQKKVDLGVLRVADHDESGLILPFSTVDGVCVRVLSNLRVPCNFG